MNEVNVYASLVIEKWILDFKQKSAQWWDASDMQKKETKNNNK